MCAYENMLLTLESSSGFFADIAKASLVCRPPLSVAQAGIQGLMLLKHPYPVSSPFRCLAFDRFSCFRTPPLEGRIWRRSKGKIQTNQLYCVWDPTGVLPYLCCQQRSLLISSTSPRLPHPSFFLGGPV